MSLVAEIIAKELGEKENLDWRRIVQLLASSKRLFRRKTRFKRIGKFGRENPTRVCELFREIRKRL
jgi:hypothetical protein